MEDINALGCKLNNISVNELFAIYKKLGFIYPQKQAQIEPYFTKIKDNWSKAVASKDKLVTILTHTLEDYKSFATVCYWPATHSTALVQHAVSSGNPISSRANLLGVLSAIYNDAHPYRAVANYFRETNKWSMKLLAKQYDVLGAEDCSLNKLSYLKLPKNLPAKGGFSTVEIIKCKGPNQAQLANLARKIRGNAYVISEDFDHSDFELNELSRIFDKNNLLYKREIYLAYQKKGEEPAAAIIANRAPLGFNFSLLENKCEILVDNNAVDEVQLKVIIDGFLPIINSIYQAIELPYIPILTDECTGKLLLSYNAEFTREYMQCIWLKDRFPDAYSYIESVYKNIFNRHQKKKSARN